MGKTLRRKTSVVRNDSLGGSGRDGHAHGGKDNFDSLTYIDDESDVWKATAAIDHYLHRGNFWNSGKHATFVRYILIALVGIVQATVAYVTNLTSAYFIGNKYSTIYQLLQDGSLVRAFFCFIFTQLVFAIIASMFVWIKPVSAGSGIPEVKCYLNGTSKV